MDVRLKEPAFLNGSRQPAGRVLTDYEGPLASWMEPCGKPAAKPRGRKQEA
ncbi:MAG: hypothetical protein AAFY02_17660 [Pseudomonadota bacterium]